MFGIVHSPPLVCSSAHTCSAPAAAVLLPAHEQGHTLLSKNTHTLPACQCVHIPPPAHHHAHAGARELTLYVANKGYASPDKRVIVVQTTFISGVVPKVLHANNGVTPATFTVVEVTGKVRGLCGWPLSCCMCTPHGSLWLARAFCDCLCMQLR